MPSKSIRVPQDLVDQVDARGDFSEVARESLSRYFGILQRGRAGLREKLSGPELMLICDANNGTIYEPWSIPMLWAGVEDRIHLDGTDAKWGIDGPALVEKLKALDTAESFALVDAVERFWHTVGKTDTTPTAEEILK